MRVPYSSFHFHTSSTNFSCPRSLRVSPRSFFSFFSTTACVAIPAWSVPGTHMTILPHMRWYRTIVSSMATVRACPMCSDPVTLGGGITITNLSSYLALAAASASQL